MKVKIKCEALGIPLEQYESPPITEDHHADISYTALAAGTEVRYVGHLIGGLVLIKNEENESIVVHPSVVEFDA